MLLHGEVGALAKVLEAYMGEVALPTNPIQGKRHNLHEHWPNV